MLPGPLMQTVLLACALAGSFDVDRAVLPQPAANKPLVGNTVALGPPVVKDQTVSW